MKKILIVEDDADILSSLVELLESEGFEIAQASNGQVALDYLNSTSKLPNLILLDVMMPIKDAAQFKLEFQVNPKISHIPVLLMSANSNLEEKKKQIGFDHCIKKPFEIDTLLGMIQTLAA